MNQQLADCQLIVTRPGVSGETLCHRIQSEGAIAIHFPTIAFAPPVSQAAFQQGIATLGDQHWLIFISPQAVYASIAAICNAWPILPRTVRLAAVGAGTARVLHAAGFKTVLFPNTVWNSESLLSLPEFSEVAHQKIAIIRGAGGREVIDRLLTERGAKITPIIAYQRILPPIDVKPYVELLKKTNGIVCTSGESVDNLKTLFMNNWNELRHIPLIVVSDRIKLLAQDLGFQTIWVAVNASHQAILEILVQKRNQLCQNEQMKSL